MRAEQIGDARLYCGDCREWLEAAPECFRVDSVVTDPPYGVGLAAKRAKQRGGGVKARKGSYGEDTPEFVRDCVVPVIEHCRDIADRVVLTPGIRNMWLYPSPDDLGCFFSAAGTGMGRWGFTCSQPILYYGFDPYLEAGLGSRANSSGQTYPNDANEVDHPCAKPIRMMNWLVARASLDDMIVLDPFMGSGTTGVACVNLGRRFIGIEIEEKYFDIACKRIDAASRQGKLFKQKKTETPVFI